LSEGANPDTGVESDVLSLFSRLTRLLAVNSCNRSILWLVSRILRALGGFWWPLLLLEHFARLPSKDWRMLQNCRTNGFKQWQWRGGTLLWRGAVWSALWLQRQDLGEKKKNTDGPHSGAMNREAGAAAGCMHHLKRDLWVVDAIKDLQLKRHFCLKMWRWKLEMQRGHMQPP